MGTFRNDAYRSREVDWVRRSVNDGFRWAGTKIICRMQYCFRDFALGHAVRCSHCYDEVLQQSNNSRCPYCYGTGYEGGYGDAFITWCSLSENVPQDDKFENAGVRPTGDMEVRLPVNKLFHNGDTFAEIREENDSGIVKLGRLFMLDGPVQQKTVQGWVSDDNKDAERATILENTMVEQRGTVKLLLPSDLIYQNSASFWGVASAPYVDDGENQDKIEGF